MLPNPTADPAVANITPIFVPKLPLSVFVISYIKKSSTNNSPTPESDGAMIRCIYESLAMKYRFAIEQIEENTGKKFDVLHLLGGGTKDGFLCQMTADSLNMDVIAGPTEATALGNIVLQLIALGDIKNVDDGREIIKSSEKLTTYKSENAGAFASNYNRFVKILNK